MPGNLFSIGVRIDGDDVGPLILAGGTIDYGREDLFEQPPGPVCELDLFTRDGHPLMPASWYEFGTGEWGSGSHFTDEWSDTYVGAPSRLVLGAPVWVSATTDTHFTDEWSDVYVGEEHRRFTGRIQAIQYERERIHVTAVTDLEWMARIGVETAPSVLMDSGQDTDRVADLVNETVAEAGVPVPLELEGDPGLTLRAMGSDDYPYCLLAALQSIADDCDGLLYANRLGQVHYRSRNWTPATYTLPPGIVDADAVDMGLELGLVENRVTVEYGTAGYFVTATDSASVTTYGPRNGRYATNLDTSTDATNHARTILNALEAQWLMPEVTLCMYLATDAQVTEICALELGDVITVDDLPAGAPVPTLDAQILGYTEYLSSADWEIELHLGPTYEIHTEA
jgi:hypothetical protein